jgi:sterol 24-C-methyltransferase
MTKYYDPKNERHNRIKKGIEVGNGLPDLEPVEHVVKAVSEAGLVVLEDKDMAEANVGDHDMHPWYQPLEGSFSFSGFKHTRMGRTLTHHCLRVLEACYLAPKGTVEVSRLLMETANDLVDGGRLRIFTPMHFILAQKPEKK